MAKCHTCVNGKLSILVGQLEVEGVIGAGLVVIAGYLQCIH